MATILIVDDRVSTRQLLLEWLAPGGHRLMEASDALEGLSLAQTVRPDLIITDIVMPNMDGYEFARRVRTDPFLQHTQIIFNASAGALAETRTIAEACGVLFVIAKPAEPEAIRHTVNAALASRRVGALEPASDKAHLKHLRQLAAAMSNRLEELEVQLTQRKQAGELLAALSLISQGSAGEVQAAGSQLLQDYVDWMRNGIAEGDEQLTGREREVVRLVGAGSTNREIAQQLSMSVRTVERHRSSIMKKLKLRNRAELVNYAVRRRILDAGS